MGSCGFFDGYHNPWAVGVVFANAVIGLAITAVYKYANAVTKCIASDVSAVLLCIISAIFFGLESSITMWCGVLVVCFAVHLYTASPGPPPKKPVAPTAEKPAREGLVSTEPCPATDGVDPPDDLDK